MNNPLVSVVVITYNSMPFVTRTLDSIKRQTYSNIELIISDDYSKKDDTVESVKKWLSINNNRFVHTQLITALENTGVPGNANRGIRATQGEYIKLIAGDDLLEDDCVENYICFFQNHPTAEIATSLYRSFEENKDGTIKIKKQLPHSEFIDDFENKEQLWSYYKYKVNITPPLFYKKSLIERMGWFDERFRFFEDTPIITKILASKIKIYFFHTNTVLYRTDSASITRFANNNSFYKTDFIDCKFDFRRKELWPLISYKNISFWCEEYSFLILYYFTIKILKNKRNRFTQAIYNIFKILNPYYLFVKLKSILAKK